MMTRQSKQLSRRALFVLGAAFCGARLASPQERKAQRTSLKIAVLTLNRDGFDPPAMTVVSGKAMLYVYNRSGVGEVDLRIQRKASGQVPAQQIKRELVRPEKSRWDNVVDFQPGEYVISDLNRPEITCNVTVLDSEKR